MQYFKTIVIQILKFIINLLFPFDDSWIFEPKIKKKVDISLVMSLIYCMPYLSIFVFTLLFTNVGDSEHGFLIKLIYLFPAFILTIIPTILSELSERLIMDSIYESAIGVSMWYLLFILGLLFMGINPNLHIAAMHLFVYVIISFLIFVVFYRINFWLELKGVSIAKRAIDRNMKSSKFTGSSIVIVGFIIFRDIPYIFLVVLQLIIIAYLFFLSDAIIHIRKEYRFRILEQQSEPPEIREARERAILDEKERKRKQKQAEKERKKKEKEQKKLYLEQQIKKDRAEMEKSKNQTEEKEIELWEV